jgi:hypothetical protein
VRLSEKSKAEAALHRMGCRVNILMRKPALYPTWYRVEEYFEARTTAWFFTANRSRK